MAKSKTYEEFVDKFKPKLTTDDCYTPPSIMEIVNDYVVNRYGVDKSSFVRPFWPGGDYKAFDYPSGCIVVDNPPFSILSQIEEFYLDNGIEFFLFAPTLTAFSSKKVCMRVNHLISSSAIVYENGAEVPTSFVTNLDTDIVAESVPDLDKRIKAECDNLRHQKARELPKYSYPDNVVHAALLQYLSRHNTKLTIYRDECVRISKMDAQIAQKKTIFGGGLLLSERAAAERAAAERAAAERAAAERAAAHKWELSERELEIIRSLG